ncbi:GlcNAc-transferase family protein [Paraherbaspirillum soli]|uniref:GlcNAc-transferase family protein n=1 Tax=Paraherbaspirillum soli TaxID=631222 RepID=A0ABW0M2U1_9BURK
MQNTIFVQIASYRDHQLLPTLSDLIEQAAHPELLRIVVCWQHAENETISDFLQQGYIAQGSEQKLGDTVHTLSYRHAGIQLIDVHYLKTQGACWARNKIQQHYRAEKYTLQLDSHHRFVPRWDSLLIEMLESLREHSPKPLLTTYLPAFDPDNDPAGRDCNVRKMCFDRFTARGVVLFLSGAVDNWQQRSRPLRARFYSAHFAFADGRFAEEVQHDPEYFFHGEEISIGVRAFTHGYDLYHPHRLVAWHEYLRKGRAKVWDDHTTPAKQSGDIAEDWVERNAKCHNRNRVLFGMDGEDPSQIDFCKYGFGNSRTLRQFEEYAGISFKHRGVQQAVRDNIDPHPDCRNHGSEEEWLGTLSRSNEIRICIHKNDLGEVLDDYAFWYLGIHDTAGLEIHRRDLSRREIDAHLRQDWWIYRLAFISGLGKIPKSYTVWPYRRSDGWANKTERPIELPTV